MNETHHSMSMRQACQARYHIPSVLWRENGNSLGSSIEAALPERTRLLSGLEFFRLRHSNRAKHNPNKTETGTTTAATIVPVFPDFTFRCEVGSGDDTGLGLPGPEFGNVVVCDAALEGSGDDFAGSVPGGGGVFGGGLDGTLVGLGFGVTLGIPHLDGTFLSRKVCSPAVREWYFLTN